MSPSAFKRCVWRYYQVHGRHDLPWRSTHDPYAIWVSELMLQQTQVSRVIPKFLAFLERFPTIETLAKASLQEVLQYWQGLGYNRRAKYLHQAAQVVSSQGMFPENSTAWRALPGIGEYTANAIMAFAYNQPVVIIETNVRTVFLHHFFPNRDQVTDAEIKVLIEQMVPKRRSRDWYYALMDYGVYLKGKYGNANIRSKHYTKQTKFLGSNRQIRGRLIKALLTAKKTESALVLELDAEQKRLQEQLAILIQEGLVKQEGRYFMLPT